MPHTWKNWDSTTTDTREAASTIITRPDILIQHRSPLGPAVSPLSSKHGGKMGVLRDLFLKNTKLLT
jgi:hypothetical protein